MSICQSCGGVIGVDCFNPSECMDITRQMVNQYEQQQNYNQSLEQSLILSLQLIDELVNCINNLEINNSVSELNSVLIKIKQFKNELNY